MKSKIIFVTGGIKSGKTSFAIKLAENTKQGVTYIATGLASDPEMKKKIGLHRTRRPAGWKTVEEPFDLLKAAKKSETPVILIDCLNFWVANVMKKRKEEEIMKSMKNLYAWLRKGRKNRLAIAVSNEVGLSLVALTGLGRKFQNLLGMVNQCAARNSDEVYFIVSGIPMQLKAPS